MTKANESNILCECGHPLSHHAIGAGQCYKFIRKIEKRKNHLDKEVKVKCVYGCTCKKFVLPCSNEKEKCR